MQSSTMSGVSGTIMTVIRIDPMARSIDKLAALLPCTDDATSNDDAEDPDREAHRDNFKVCELASHVCLPSGLLVASRKTSRDRGNHLGPLQLHLNHVAIDDNRRALLLPIRHFEP